MLSFLFYAIKVIVCSGILYGYYLLALRNNRFHQWNRWYLLFTILVSFTLPILNIPLPDIFNSSPVVVQSVQFFSPSSLYFSGTQKQETFHLSLPLITISIYVLISLFFLSVFVRHLLFINNVKKKYKKERVGDIHFYNTLEEGTPFSFFKNIFWNNNIELDTDKGRQMLRHEMAHVAELHSADKISIELLFAFAFWNPFLYYIRKELSVIHEFIADQKASAGDDHLQYASLLLTKAMGSEQFALGNPFFHSQLKRRLTMLTTIKNPKFSYVRRLLVLPLSAVSIILFSFKYQHINDRQKFKSQVRKSVLLPAKPFTEEQMVVHGFYQDSGKKKVLIKTMLQYKGKLIESIIPTTDLKGVVVKTTDKETYFLNRQEAAREFSITITDSGISVPSGASMVTYDKDDVSAEHYPFKNLTKSFHQNDQSTPLETTDSSTNLLNELAKKKLIIVDGATIDAAKLKELNTSNVNTVEILTGGNAMAQYGEKGKYGVIKITTKKPFPNEPLYVIDGVESTNKDAEALNPDVIESIDVFKDAAAINKWGEKGKNGVVLITTKKSANKAVFSKVEEPAHFPGGLEGWRNYLAKSLKYPEAAQQKGTQGTVRVQMTVEKDGNISGIKALNDPGNGLADEAIRVIQKGPKWVPAKQNNQEVAYQLIQTLTFQLQ